MIAARQDRPASGSYRLFRHAIVALTAIILLLGAMYAIGPLLLGYLVRQLLASALPLPMLALVALGGAIFGLNARTSVMPPDAGDPVDAAWWMALFPALGSCAGTLSWGEPDEADK